MPCLTVMGGIVRPDNRMTVIREGGRIVKNSEGGGCGDVQKVVDSCLLKTEGYGKADYVTFAWMSYFLCKYAYLHGNSMAIPSWKT
jgi:hypothetical protein